MGSALMQGIIKAGIVQPENIGASDVYEPFLKELRQSWGSGYQPIIPLLSGSRISSFLQ